NNNAEPALIQLRYQLKSADIQIAEEPFEAAGRKFNRGSFVIRNVAEAELQRVGSELGLWAYGLPAPPAVKTHPARVARVAILHTWLSTQDEGWWRLAFDQLKIPYGYISTQEVAKNDNLNAKYDVIVFPPVGRGKPQG